MRKSILAAVGATAALAIVGGSVAYATKSKNVTVSIDGQVQKVHTYGSTVADALAAKNITLGEHDLVAPSADSKLEEGQEIAVQYGRQLTVNADGKKKVFWTTEDSVSEALGTLGLRYDGAHLSTSRSASIGREGLALTVRTPKQVTVVRAGKPVTFKTVGLTVGEALSAANAKIDGNDKVAPALSTRLVSGTKIIVVKVDRKSVTEVVKVPFTTTKTKSATLFKGDTETKTEGKAGKKSVGYVIELHDGKVVSKKRGATKVITAPVAEIVLVGTKAKPEPKPEPEPEPDGSSEEPSTGDTGPWDRIAECESGGNWSTNTGNGYYGGLQFSHQTWVAYGGDKYANNAHQASKAQQIAIAEKVRAARGGYGDWPHCGKRA